MPQIDFNDLPKDSVGLVTPRTHNFAQPLELVSGGTLPGFDLIYETYGSLNDKKSNAILICHALSSDHHVAGYHNKTDKKSGWWENIVGPGKAIDTNLWFVVCCNNIGGCAGSTGPSSINPETGKPYGPDFPIITVRDWVKTQTLLADMLDIACWAAVVGGSLGGMQVIQWAADYPDRLKNAIIIASAAKLTAQNIAFNEVARQAIITDPDFHAGHYYEHNTIPKQGLRIARMLGHITYLSDDIMHQKFGRGLQEDKISFDYDIEFQVESYLHHQANTFVEKFDANTYLLMTRALDYFDPAADYDGSLSLIFENSKANFLVVSFTSDWRFAPSRSREIVRALHDNDINVSYAEVSSHFGHDSFLFNIKNYTDVLSAYTTRIYNELS